ARRRLSQLAPQLRQAVGPVQVSGHSDSIGADAYNLTLSRKRAQAVRDELERVLGSGVRIDAKGYGEARPAVPEGSLTKSDGDARAQNRRVEITFTRR
ncbi:OmpA family protein, partial [Actinomadura adrarensis]